DLSSNSQELKAVSNGSPKGLRVHPFNFKGS
ncbi:unnamed protein product, partial [marine sediment metagenome]